MRQGIITRLLASEDMGTIKDENEQDIEFSLKESKLRMKEGDRVHFEIALTAFGLIATQIDLI